jgi:hypothetical protein
MANTRSKKVDGRRALRKPPEQRLSPSAREFVTILDNEADTPLAKLIKGRLDASQISRYRRGVTEPALETALWLDEVSNGRISTRGWNPKRRDKAA